MFAGGGGGGQRKGALGRNGLIKKTAEWRKVTHFMLFPLYLYCFVTEVPMDWFLYDKDLRHESVNVYWFSVKYWKVLK